MGHYVRILSPAEHVVGADELQSAIAQEQAGERISIKAGSNSAWTELLLAHSNGTPIAVIERNPVAPGSLGAEEIREFIDEVARQRPETAARWVQNYLPRVRTIYAFQILSGVRMQNSWRAIGVVQEASHRASGGIIQADWEGFSNEEGYHVLWQFRDDVTGQCWMALLKNDDWVTFEMDLGSRRHREAFLRGEIPAGVKISRPMDNT